MKLCSIDIETSGLSPFYAHVMEVGMVLFDHALGENQEGLSRFRLLVVPQNGTYWNCGEVQALAMHSRLLKELAEADFSRLEEEGYYQDDRIQYPPNQTTFYVQENILMSLMTRLIHDSNWAVDGKITAAGKNFDSFDRRFIEKLTPANEDELCLEFHHRAVDPTIMYIESDDQRPPNLRKCLERAGMEPTDIHTALGDAVDVARLICHKFRDPESTNSLFA